MYILFTDQNRKAEEMSRYTGKRYNMQILCIHSKKLQPHSHNVKTKKINEEH